MKEEKPLHILFVEDLPSDAVLAEREIRKSGLEFTSQRVDTEEAFVKAMEDFRPDVIVSDYSMPEFDGARALKLSLEHDSRIPFILLTGSINEETAVACMKAGATDYVIKEQRKRLPFAIHEALARKKMRLAKEEAEQALRSREAYLSAIIENQPGLIWLKDTEGRFLAVNHAFAVSCGRQAPKDVVGKTDLDVWPREIAEKYRADDLNVMRTMQSIMVEELVYDKGEAKCFETFKTPVKDADGRIMGTTGYARDITERKQVEESLVKLSKAIDTSGDAIFLTDRDGIFTFVNPGFTSLYGYAAAEVVGKVTPRILKSGLQGSDVYDAFWKTLLSGQEARGEHKNKRKDGTLVDVDGSANAILGERKNIIGFLGIQHDITERKRAEEALAKSEEGYRDLVEHSLDLICTHDVKGNLLSVNPAATKFIGFTEEELVGKNLRDFLAPGGRRLFKSYLDRIQATGSASGLLSVITKSGEKRIWEYFNTLRTVGVSAPLVRGLARDITERKSAEEALEKSEQQYRQFFEDDLTGDYISTPGGKILSCNPAFARIFGFASVEEALNTDASTVFNEPESKGKFLHLLREKKRLEYYESEFLRRDGSRVYCIENAVGVFDPKGNLVQIRGYIFDDTKRKLLERQLVQAQKLESLGTLASGIAHDFNNILGIIIGYATLLARRDPNPESIKISVDAVLKASQRGAALVKQLLTFARKVDVQLQSVRLNDVVNELAKLMGETMPKTIEIALHLKKDLPAITGDPNQIHQVLLNLCLNARDAMPNGGTLTVATQLQQGDAIRNKFPKAAALHYVALSVADTGVGMDERTRSRIFEPFFTTKEVGKGTGLGLSVVFGIMESHKGFVNVESEPGKGTTFYLYFPVPESMDIEQAMAGIRKEIPGGTETILVVEDEELLRELLRTDLQTAGYTVLTAVDGQEAIDLFDQRRGDIKLVLSDAGLPKLSGYNVFKKMKGTKPNLRFILASGFIEPQMKSELYKEGIKAFVQKPYSVSELLQTIRTILDMK